MLGERAEAQVGEVGAELLVDALPAPARSRPEPGATIVPIRSVRQQPAGPPN